MTRSLNTETIRKMDRDELIEELRALGESVDEQDESADNVRTDDNLRDDLCRALEAAGDPEEARGDHLRDMAKATRWLL